MSRILQLQISGVRAFDNHDTQYLTFNSPLTLICGQNGVGKTTIIESLRYVTTGDLPPNVKGGAFVHDPRMSAESEVLAQVRLLFQSVAGARMVATRSMKLSVSKGNKMSFKTLEGAVKEQKDTHGGGGGGGLTSSRSGSKTSVSARSADLNQQVPLLLGVPAAILNYVVFCHQEDSLWPFAEPAAVKKKFDDIFEATKYTKALDSLKTIRKEYIGNIKVETKDVEHLEQDKTRAAEREAQLGDLVSRVSEIKSETDLLQQRRVAASAELNATVEHNQRVQQIRYAVADINTQISRYSQDAELLRADLTDVIPEEKRATDDIESELSQGTKRQQALNEELRAKNAALEELQTGMVPLNEELAMLDNQQGRLEQLIEAHQQRQARLAKLVAKGRRQLEGRHHDDDNVDDDDEIDAGAVESYRRAIELVLNKLGLKLDSLEAANRKQQLELTQKISLAEARQLQLIEVVNSSREAIHASEQDERQVQQQLDELAQKNQLGNFNDTISGMKSRITGLENERELAAADLRKFEDGKALQTAIHALKSAEDRADSSRQQLARVIDASNRLSQLHHLEARHAEIEQKVSSAWSALRSATKTEQKDSGSTEAVGTSAELSNCADSVRQAEAIISKLKHELELAQSSVSKLETHCQIEGSNLSSLRSRGAAARRRAMALGTQYKLSKGTVASFDGRLSEAEAAVLEATEEQEQLSFAHKYFERALKRAEQPHNPSCVLCEHIKTPEEANRLVKLLKDKIGALEITPEEAQQELDQRKKAVEELKALAPRVQEFRSILSDQNTIEDETTQLEKGIADLEKELSEARRNQEVVLRKYTTTTKTVEPILNSINRFNAEAAEVAAKIELERSIMGATEGSDTEPTMSLTDAQSHQEQCERELRLERSTVESRRTEYERLRGRCEAAAQKVKDLRLAISELELTSSRARQLEDKLHLIEQEQARHLNVQQEAESKLPAVAESIEQLQKELTQRKFSDSQSEKAIAEQRHAHFQTLRQLNELCKEVEEFSARHGIDPLAKLEESRSLARSKMSALSDDIEAAQKSIRETERIIADFSSFRRNLQDNVRLRQYGAKQARLADKRQNLEAELYREQSQFGSSPEELEQKIRALQEELGEINHRVSKMAGELKALQEQTQGIRHELATSYHDTAINYEKAVAQLNSSRGAAHELAQYLLALDRSIMKYHHMKMDEINDLLDQMWKQTYTGTDIDSIMICSEPGDEVGTAGAASSNRTSHNYRVCMIKQDTVLDMRGRCSAGQKVLASILIRMALAECFGNSSGLIVLDEPTTNLDHENIEALARSLSEIIAMRRVQSNFQLIVITHDEHFLTQMNPSSYCSSFYKISRDERQLSTISKLPISGLS